ncbi:MAG TPA: hypothetical protein VM598_09360 [Bdellovibrionota bacterium]|nr:hypothetical protein [Bdellovibrionota bacterium]
MAEIGRVYPTDIQRLRRELEAQGELLMQERLDRKAEVDELSLEIEALKQLLARMHPGFLARYQETLVEERRIWNPELRKREA